MPRLSFDTEIEIFSALRSRARDLKRAAKYYHCAESDPEFWQRSLDQFEDAVTEFITFHHTHREPEQILAHVEDIFK